MTDADARRRAVAIAAQLPTSLADALRILGYAVDLARFMGGQTDDVKEGTTPIADKLAPNRTGEAGRGLGQPICVLREPITI